MFWKLRKYIRNRKLLKIFRNNLNSYRIVSFIDDCKSVKRGLIHKVSDDMVNIYVKEEVKIYPVSIDNVYPPIYFDIKWN